MRDCCVNYGLRIYRNCLSLRNSFSVRTVVRTKVQPTLATLHGQVLTTDASLHRDADNKTLILSLLRKRRALFKGLWSRLDDPPVIPVAE